MRLLLLSDPEYRDLTGLLQSEAGDDGPLLSLLERLCPTYTAEECGCGAELSWEDCSEGHTDCYQTVCETPYGCGAVERDCEDSVELLEGLWVYWPARERRGL